MSFLLDTNVISELRKKPSARTEVFNDWADSMSVGICAVSVVTLFELERGVLLLERRDPNQCNIMRAWLDSYVLPVFKKSIVPIDVETALKAASLHVPDPAPFFDALIAASALTKGYIVVTRNTKDFERFGVTCINPWVSVSSSQ